MRVIHFSPLGAVLLGMLLLVTSCSGNAPAVIEEQTTESIPTVVPIFDMPATAVSATSNETDFLVQVDIMKNVHAISPLIYGLSGGTPEYWEMLRPTLVSWGGNPSTRYNWQIGHAWNSGSDWFYRNGNFGYTGASASDDFMRQAEAVGAETRLAIPTLGWVAKNDDNNTCSFPLPEGGCGDGQGSNCDNPREIADPGLANIPSTPESIVAWMHHLYEEQEFSVRFLAMDNEPELWGYTHYDVHPDCTTYAEILEKYLTYATAVREVAPDAELTGPVTCCWQYYWNSAAGSGDKEQHGNQDFLPWFLDNVRQFDEENGQRTLHVLDIHYYPEGVYNDDTDVLVAAQRLRSTRSLWDKTYSDESWIGESIFLIPRMKELIEQHYPGTRLGISEWNWGADDTMNGALAIADVLGIFGREDLYFAAYWRNPPMNSPGFYAFKMYTNYDGLGSRFGDTSIATQSEDVSKVSSYAALDSESGNLHIMLINKQVDEPITVRLDLQGFAVQPTATRYTYKETETKGIQTQPLHVDNEAFFIDLPPYSINLLVLEPAQ